MPRQQLVHDEAGLQQVYPGSGGGLGHAGIVAQADQIQQLRGTAGAQAHKALKPLQVLHGGKLAQVTLDIG